MIIQDIVIPESKAQVAEWMAYFDKLKEKFGEDNARVIWLRTWQVNGSVSLTTRPEFSAYLKKHDIDVSNAATRAVADISQIGSSMAGLGKNLSKGLAVGIPLTLGVVVILILFFLYKTTRDTNIKDLVALTPQGRMLNVLR